MAADPRDQFSGFTGDEHIFLLLDDPLRLIRDELEHGLREQVADTVLASITMAAAPKFLTVGQRGDDDAMTVQHFGFCLRARLAVGHTDSDEHEELDAALTFLFGHLDRPGQEQLRTYFDLLGDAEAGFSVEVFDQRFDELCSDLAS